MAHTTASSSSLLMEQFYLKLVEISAPSGLLSNFLLFSAQVLPQSFTTGIAHDSHQLVFFEVFYFCDLLYCFLYRLKTFSISSVISCVFSLSNSGRNGAQRFARFGINPFN